MMKKIFAFLLTLCLLLALSACSGSPNGDASGDGAAPSSESTVNPSGIGQ